MALLFLIVAISLVTAQLDNPPATPGEPDIDPSDDGGEDPSDDTTSDENGTQQEDSENQTTTDQSDQDETQQDSDNIETGQDPSEQQTQETETQPVQQNQQQGPQQTDSTRQDGTDRQEQTDEGSDWVLYGGIAVLLIAFLIAIFYFLNKHSSHFDIKPEHRRFVESCKRKGMPRSQVVKELEEHGYKEGAIEELLKDY